MVRESCSGITAQLRWFSSAVALVNREDRTEALIDRYEKCPARLEQVETLYQRLLLHLDDVPMESLPKERREQVHEDYVQSLGLADEISQRAREILASRAGVPPTRASLKTPVGLLTRLPNLDLPHFDGRLDAWMGFIGLFESLVDSREDLSLSQKLAYLLSVLDGEARELVQHLPICEGSYAVARSLLTKRYQNQRCLADAHIDQIMDIPVVSNTAQLRTKMLNPLVAATNALSRLGLPVDQSSYWLVRIMLKRLPVSLRARFEQAHTRDEASPLPSYEQLLAFLENECRMGDVMDAPVGLSSSGPTNKRRTAQMAPKGRASPRFAVAQAARPVCRFCKSRGHRTMQCPDFVALHVASRRRIAKARGWCFSCLGDHFQRACPDMHPCPVCGGQHLKVLCANANGRRDHPGSPSGGYESGHRAQSRNLESGSPPPRHADCAAVDRRHDSARSPTGGYGRGPRVQSRTFVPRSPSPHPRDLSRSPPVIYHDYRDARPVRLPSPPLAERPRLEPRNPQYGRSRRYEPPTMARGSRHREEGEFKPLPRFDVPSRDSGDRSPPRQH
ncbi:uncharacterized protein LOC123663034 [Melitaea cinxia]|uniref:uncharacterized protein LOC123663034 n=1 Tax=Melitaea cinxia TaxID=113334 RepID=UPI001E271AB6|nr:uncharacterized protein LOC123663034 [Melitaea cinxia]